MKRLLGLDIRKGEWSSTLLLFFNIYILLVTYYLLKPARDSLFLVQLGPEQLPLVFIFTALVIVPVTNLYARASRKLKLNQLINLTLAVIIVCLVVLRWLMTLPYDFVPYTFYIWVSIYGALTTSQFWLLANAVYDASQAKRLFPLLGLSAILGAWNGGVITTFIVKTLGVGTENLLYFCIAFLLMSMLLTTLVWRARRKEADEKGHARRKNEPKESILALFRSIKTSRHLLLIVGIISITMIVASLVDFQFKAASSIAFQDPVTGEIDKSSLTAFLGSFYGWLSLGSILVQTLIAYRLLRTLGVGIAIMVLPIGLLMGSVVMFFSVGITAAVLLRGADGALMYSIDKTSRELLFLPISLDLKKRTKVFIDLFVDRWARGLAGGLLLALIWLFNYNEDPIEAVRMISLVVIGLIALWIVMTLMMRREYVNTFRTAIEKRQIDLSELRHELNDASTIQSLIGSLSCGNEREICYALDLLGSTRSGELVEPVRPLLRHRSIDVRRKALQVLLAQENMPPLPEVKQLLDDQDCIVVRDAMHYISRQAGGGDSKGLQVFLRHPDARYRAAALAAIAHYGTSEEKQLVDETLIEGLLGVKGEAAPEARRTVAESLGNLANPRFSKYLKRLMSDSDPLVVRGAIGSVGRLGEREFVPGLISSLGNRRYRAQARAALADFGRSILGTLNDYLSDTRVDMSIRRNIPRVFAAIPVQESVDILTSLVKDAEPGLKYFIVKALSRLRADYPELRFNETRVDEALIAETRTYYEVMQVIRAAPRNDSPASRLLLKALEEKQDNNLERIFRLLGLAYSARDMFAAYQGVTSSRREIRASAIEFLDNILRGNVKRFLIPILDPESQDAIVRQGRNLFGIRLDTLDESLTYLLKGRDSWLKACAVYCAAESGSNELLTLVREATGDPDPVVRETADFALRKMVQNPGQG